MLLANEGFPKTMRISRMIIDYHTIVLISRVNVLKLKYSQLDIYMLKFGVGYFCHEKISRSFSSFPIPLGILQTGRKLASNGVEKRYFNGD